MLSFSSLDIFIVVIFFSSVLITGFAAGRRKNKTTAGYLLSGRNVGLFLFILTNVATWYGGILGVGEFTYRYGIVSWFTQGFPYYVFAILFAIFFSKKIRKASLFTIPEKLTEVYGKPAGLFSAVLIFVLVSPAPYLLMIGYLLSVIFNIKIFYALVIGIIVSTAYLFKGGYRSNIYTDAIQFFVMFIGFIVIIISALTQLGGIEYLSAKLPEAHLSITGGTSPVFLLVWFLIALWTFADPGFHQRCYSAKSGKVAEYGIVISVFFWMLFDLLTTATGLYSKAVIPNLSNPVLSFPFLAEKILSSGWKGLFYAALFATILSTLNSFMFLSATTIGRDFLVKIKKPDGSDKSIKFTQIGLGITAVLSLLLSLYFDSVINMWYTIGSICIPGIILLVVGAYYQKLKVSNTFALIEMAAAVCSSIVWLIIRSSIPKTSFLFEIEPMIVGLTVALIIHCIGVFRK